MPCVVIPIHDCEAHKQIFSCHNRIPGRQLTAPFLWSVTWTRFCKQASNSTLLWQWQLHLPLHFSCLPLARQMGQPQFLHQWGSTPWCSDKLFSMHTTKSIFCNVIACAFTLSNLFCYCWWQLSSLNIWRKVWIMSIGRKNCQHFLIVRKNLRSQKEDWYVGQNWMCHL